MCAYVIKHTPKSFSIPSSFASLVPLQIFQCSLFFISHSPFAFVFHEYVCAIQMCFIYTFIFKCKVSALGSFGFSFVKALLLGGFLLSLLLNLYLVCAIHSKNNARKERIMFGAALGRYIL